MQPGKRYRAHSLIELMVASTLLIVLMGSVVLALVNCNNYVRNSETKIDAQKQALQSSIWVSRSLSEANITSATNFTTPASGVSFPSPRNQATGDVAWSSSTGGALEWRQLKFVYLDQSQDPGCIVVRGYPLYYTGAGVNPAVMWTGFPPFPANGIYDLGQIGLQPLSTLVYNSSRPPDKVLGQNIRVFAVDIYRPDDLPSRASTANIIVESFAPYYNLDYGIRVVTTARLKN